MVQGCDVSQTLVSSSIASGGDQSAASQENTPRGSGSLPRFGIAYLPRRDQVRPTRVSVLIRLVALSTAARRFSGSAMRGR